MNRSTVLVVEDDDALRQALSDTLQLAGYTVVTAAGGKSALEHLADEELGIVISDIKMDGMDGHQLLKNIKKRRTDLPVLLMTAFGTIQQAVVAMRDGATDYLVKPFEAEVLVNAVSRYLPPQLNAGDGDPIAVDAATHAVFDRARQVADSDATVMISGESGTGKEVLARYIHQYSPRAAQPFVAVNCAAIPENMLEATLFGYEKGAFTGAYQACPGKFEQAQGGTLLLDEISEMDLGLQAKLLRVLQEKEVERLGGRKLIDLDVRVLATSNRRLKEEVAAGRFREDLFYRLTVFPLHLPPLRERVDDIEPLAEYLLAKYAAAQGRPMPSLTQAASAGLRAHAWPGNVRELENLVQRALILQREDQFDVDDLQFELSPADSVVTTDVDGGGADNLGDDLKTREQELIIEALERASGQRKAAAARLGISERTLRYKLARMREAGIALPMGVAARGAG